MLRNKIHIQVFMCVIKNIKVSHKTLLTSKTASSAIVGTSCQKVSVNTMVKLCVNILFIF